MHKFISGARAAVLIAAALTTAPAFAAHTGSGPSRLTRARRARATALSKVSSRIGDSPLAMGQHTAPPLGVTTATA